MRATPRKIFRIAVAVALLIIISCLVWGFFIEPNRLIVRQETIQIDNWPKELSGLRIAVMAIFTRALPPEIVILTIKESEDAP